MTCTKALLVLAVVCIATVCVDGAAKVNWRYQPKVNITTANMLLMGATNGSVAIWSQLGGVYNASLFNIHRSEGKPLVTHSLHSDAGFCQLARNVLLCINDGMSTMYNASTGEVMWKAPRGDGFATWNENYIIALTSEDGNSPQTCSVMFTANGSFVQSLNVSEGNVWSAFLFGGNKVLLNSPNKQDEAGQFSTQQLSTKPSERKIMWSKFIEPYASGSKQIANPKDNTFINMVYSNLGLGTAMTAGGLNALTGDLLWNYSFPEMIEDFTADIRVLGHGEDQVFVSRQGSFSSKNVVLGVNAINGRKRFTIQQENSMGLGPADKLIASGDFFYLGEWTNSTEGTGIIRQYNRHGFNTDSYTFEGFPAIWMNGIRLVASDTVEGQLFLGPDKNSGFVGILFSTAGRDRRE